MTLTIKEIQDPSEWEHFVLSGEKSLFSQSNLNGEFHREMGGESWIYGIYKEGTLIGGSLVLGVRAKRANFLLLPYGPIIFWTSHDELALLITELTSLAKKKGYHFIRMSPYALDTQGRRAILAQVGAKKSPIHILAEHTVLLSLEDPLEDMLQRMNKNHRNLIRRCERDGVQVNMTQSADALERLNCMLDVIKKRHGFQRFSREFIEKEFAVFAKAGKAEIFEATLPDGSVDSSAIIIFYGDMACYRHSASLQQDNRLPTPYLIQWKVIEEAKRRGMKWYNFWGVAPTGASTKHPFYGITHFKKGFGGAQEDLLPCHDLPLSPRYRVNWMIETLRSKRRGFS